MNISLGGCVMNQSFTGSTLTGYTVWNLTYSNIALLSNTLYKLNSQGLPVSTAQGVPLNCDQLACYNNQPSTYVCNSTGAYSYQCVRTAITCPSSGCADGRCKTYGNWNNGQIVSDCSNYYYPTCISTDRCKVAYCNASVSDARSPNACYSIPYNVTSYCDDGDFCTLDLCDSNSTNANPCYHVAYTQAQLRKTFCKNYQPCEVVSCIVNSCIYTPINCNYTGLCTYYVCNSTTNNTCVAVNSTVYQYDACGVCLGNGYSCVRDSGIVPNGVSIGLAVGLGVGITGCFALCAAIFAARKGYDKYQELAAELNGQVKVSEAYKGADTGGENFGLRESAMENWFLFFFLS